MTNLKKTPNGWATCTYYDLLDYIQPTQFIVDSTDYNDEYPIPVLTAGKSFIKGYTDEKHGIFERYPAIIFDDFTTASRYVNFPFKVKSSAMKILIPSGDQVNLKFVYYLMQSNQIRSDTHKRYWISVYAKKKLLMPPFNEQERIVGKIEELFSELDKGIESLQTAKKQLEIYRQAVLKHAFEGKLTEKWREENRDKLDSADQLLARIKNEREISYQNRIAEWKAAVKDWEASGKDGKKPSKVKFSPDVRVPEENEMSTLPVLPEGYVYTYLANLGDLGRGKSKHRPRNDPKLFGGTYPFIQTGEVKAANRIIREFGQTYNEFGLAQSKEWPEGTLCITIAANIAETAFLGFDGCFPDSIVGFTPIVDVVTAAYIELFIQAVRVRIEAYAPATAQKNINLTTLENLVVPLCSPEEQRTVVNEVEALLSVIDNNDAQLDLVINRGEFLRQAILKRAFSGQLVEQDPNDEPASVLLERIRAEKAKNDKAKEAGKKKSKKKSKSKASKKATKRKDAA